MKEVISLRWLHVSDLHIIPNSANSGTLLMWDKFPDYLRAHNLVVDAVLITGDFRFAKTQQDTDDNAKHAVEMLLHIAEAAGVKRSDGSVDIDRIFTIPGNHDLDRSHPNREDLIAPIKKKYADSFADGVFSSDNLKLMLDSFSFYKRVLKRLYGENGAQEKIEGAFNASPHTYICFQGVSILLLNTALLCLDSTKTDPHTLLVGHSYVARQLAQIKEKHPDAPVIVMAHHSLDQLDQLESNELKKLFHQYNVKLYLCGHAHTLWHESINCIEQITMGCLQHTKGTQAGFSIGEYDPLTATFILRAFEWRQDYSVPKWTPHLGFGDREDGSLQIDTLLSHCDGEEVLRDSGTQAPEGTTIHNAVNQMVGSGNRIGSITGVSM